MASCSLGGAQCSTSLNSQLNPRSYLGMPSYTDDYDIMPAPALPPLTGENLRKQNLMNGGEWLPLYLVPPFSPQSLRPASRSCAEKIVTPTPASVEARKRRYSLDLFEYTKAMWEDVRLGIE